MLECFTLREQVHAVRQELAHALYQQDAACRVIARLTKERDEAKRQLTTAQAQLAAGRVAPQGAGLLPFTRPYDVTLFARVMCH